MIEYIVAGVSLLSGGPDGYGYIYLSTQDGDSIPMEWVDIKATGTPTYLTDDGEVNVPIGFSFPIYTSTYDTVRIGANGALVFNLFANVNPVNGPIPSGTNDFIAVLWDDLDPSSFGEVYYQSFTDCPDAYSGACLVVQWDSVPHYGSSVPQFFEVILYDNGDIKMQYLDLDENYAASTTIGIQAADTTGGNYIQYVYDGGPYEHIPLDSTVILFKRPPAPFHSIAEIQGTLIPGTDSSAYAGYAVTTIGVVTSIGAKSSSGFHIQMPEGGPYSGIMVYLLDTTGGFGNLQIGDKVYLTGLVTEFYGYTEIVAVSMGDVLVLSHGNAFAVDTITASMISNDNPDTAEMYEGVMVYLPKVSIDSEATYYYYISDPTGTALLSKSNIDSLPVGFFISARGINTYSYGEYKLLARGPYDINLPTIAMNTIQEDMDSTYSSLLSGDTVQFYATVQDIGVVNDSSLFLFDMPYGPYYGLYAYFPQGLPSFLNPGDRILVAGYVDEYEGNTRLVVFDTVRVLVVDTGNTLPGPMIVSAGYLDTSSTSTYYDYQPELAEAYEHILVRVESLMVTGYDTTSFGDFFMVQATNGVDTIYFRVDTAWGIPAIGDLYTVTGYVYTISGLYTLLPRSSTDLVQIVESGEVALPAFVKLASMDRNGIVIRYNLNQPRDIAVRVYSVNGRLVVNRTIHVGTGTGVLRIPARLSTGVYVVNLDGRKFKTIVR